MNTQLLTPEENGAVRAGEILRRGGVVAIPTETVYGLAASALDEGAVGRIFAAKGRPSDNPLIVHICELDQLPLLWREVPQRALRLAKAFWPGPLTIVLPKTDAVPACVSAGLDTVGVRFPASEQARAVIRAAGVPLAAPSANASGRPSPTEAQHVLEDMDGKIDAVLDGGPCPVGVESTVLDLTGERPRILRPGAITLEMIEDALGRTDVDDAVFRPAAEGEAPRAPGMKYRHYAPKAPVIVFEGAPDRTAAEIQTRLQAGDGVLGFDDCRRAFSACPDIVCYGKSYDSLQQSRELFSALRFFDSLPCKRILAQGCRPYGVGAAVRNRLCKAAGFQTEAVGVPCVLGVTGRSGSGKSLLTSLAAEMGAAVISADAVYAHLAACDTDLLAEMAKHFPDEVTPAGIDRRALARKVFTDAAARRTLNEITHPAVVRAMALQLRQQEESGTPFVVLDVPLLFESGADRLCTVTCAVLSDVSHSIERICARDNISESHALARLQSQSDDPYYLQRCDFTLRNDGEKDDFIAQCREFLRKTARI